jgi:hypothetical protein
LAPTDPARALKLARSIGEPWYRCQALSYAALHHAEPHGKEHIIDKAVDAALMSGTEPVGHRCAWPIKVLAMSGRVDRVAREADRLLELIQTEPSRFAARMPSGIFWRSGSGGTKGDGTSHRSTDGRLPGAAEEWPPE